MSAVQVATPAKTDPVPIVRKHHWLVRLTHWLNIPLLLGLGLSGLSIYWASPVYQHKPDIAGNTDYFADLGIGLYGRARYDEQIRYLNSHNLPAPAGFHPETWFYDHFSLGPHLLAEALRLHWLFAYLFMANGLLYVVGLIAGGGFRALLPRRSDAAGIVAMIRYYLGLLPAKIARRAWPHPQFAGKYNPLQRMAYLSMPLFGLLAVATGWAIHKPQQLGWLQGVFGGYDLARVWHFWLLWIFASFVVPHVVLVFADGWDTFRSMVTGWSRRTPHSIRETQPAPSPAAPPSTDFPGLKPD